MPPVLFCMLEEIIQSDVFSAGFICFFSEGIVLYICLVINLRATEMTNVPLCFYLVPLYFAQCESINKEFVCF